MGMWGSCEDPVLGPQDQETQGSRGPAPFQPGRGLLRELKVPQPRTPTRASGQHWGTQPPHLLSFLFLPPFAPFLLAWSHPSPPLGLHEPVRH